MTNDERKLAYRIVADWMSKGFSRQSIRKMIAAKFDITSEATQNAWMSKAAGILGKAITAERLMQQNSARLDTIIESCMVPPNDEDGIPVYKNPTAAIRAIEVQNKMFGIGTDKKEQNVQIDASNIVVKFGE